MTRSSSDLHVVLVEPEIHWNTGNAGRTCLAADAQLHLVKPLGFSLDERQVRRAGLDYWEHVDLRVWPGWDAFERELPSLGTPYLFTARAERRFQDVAYAKPAVLIFGRESVGLDPQILARHAAGTLAIPMLDRELRSLNLSTSVALALYEVRRQWRWPPPSGG